MTISRRYGFTGYFITALLCVLLSAKSVKAQCPPNIGFEYGTLENWLCQLGTIDKDGVIHLGGITSYADPERQKIYKNIAPQVFDKYGNFPVNCPNGSGYSIRLGNLETGNGAERVSYVFTIPADKNYYSIIYNYAVVLQNPNHMPYQQPKFSAKVFDVDANQYITCSSFDYAASSNLPGFIASPVAPDVVFKNWSPVTIKLVGYAGKTIRLEFTTNDCTQGGHFGYAYLDVDEDCSSPIKGAVYCPGDKNVQMTAPYGFAGYRWFPGDFSAVLGTGSSQKFSPAPAAGSVFAVELTPYPSQGCLDTVYATVKYSPDTVHLKLSNQTIDACISSGVNITDTTLTAGSSPGLTYSYFTDSLLVTHLFSPDSLTNSGTYYIKAANEDGCYDSKPVNVVIYPLPSFTPAASPYTLVRPKTVDLTTLMTGDAGISYTFWQDRSITLPLQTGDIASKAGTYYIKATSAQGCTSLDSITVKLEDPPITISNAFSPNGDGINDYWENPTLTYYDDCIVEIFTRQGQRIYRSVGYTKPWDGKLNGKPLPVGTYYYMIKPTSYMAPIGGSVTILR